MKIKSAKTLALNSLISGTVSLTAATLMVKLLGLIYKIPLSYILGDAGMGYFNSAYTVYSLFYVIAISGVPKAVTILVSEKRALGDNFGAKKIYSVAFSTFLFFGIVVCLLLIFFSLPLARLVGNEKSAVSLAIIAPSIIFTSVSGVIRGYLCAETNFSSVAKSQVVDAVARTGFGIALAMLAFRLGYSDEYVAAYTITGATMGSFLSFLYLYIASKSTKTEDKTKQCFVDSVSFKEALRRIFKIATPLTIGAIAMNLTSIIDLALIMRRLVAIGYTEAQANSLYGNYSTMVTPMLNLVSSVIAPVTISVMPALATAYTNGNREEFNEKISLAFKFANIIAFPIAFGMTFYSKEVLMIIFDDTGAAVAAPLLSLASSGIVFISMSLVINTALEACGRFKAPIYTTFIAAIIKVAVSYFMIGNSFVGISGAPIGTVVFYTVSTIIGGVVLLIKCKVRIPFLTAILLPFFNSAVMIIISGIVLKALDIEKSNGKYALSSILICVIVYGILTIFSVLFQYNNEKVRQNVQKNTAKII